MSKSKNMKILVENNLDEIVSELERIGCCSGCMCGCMGYPVLAKGCKCGQKVDESKMSEQEVLIFNNVEWVGEETK